MVLIHASVCWLVNTLEACTLSRGRIDFYKTYRDDTKALFAHRQSNAYGHFLEVTEYDSGSGGRGLLAIPEGVEGKGWNSLAMKLKQVMPMPKKALVLAPRLDREMDKGKAVVTEQVVRKGGVGWCRE